MVPTRSSVPSAWAADISATDKVPPTMAKSETCTNPPQKRRLVILSSVMNKWPMPARSVQPSFTHGTDAVARKKSKRGIVISIAGAAVMLHPFLLRGRYSLNYDNRCHIHYPPR
ncbi:MAG: hypothetical protein VB142_11860 [Burkholderia sp.]